MDPRILLNYFCIDHAALSDHECADLVAGLQAPAAAKVKFKKNNDTSAQWPINTHCDTWRGPLIRKIVAQWNDLANHGKVKNRRLEACRIYCERQTGVSRLEWFTKANFNQIIEGLKSWQTR